MTSCDKGQGRLQAGPRFEPESAQPMVPQLTWGFSIRERPRVAVRVPHRTRRVGLAGEEPLELDGHATAHEQASRRKRHPTPGIDEARERGERTHVVRTEMNVGSPSTSQTMMVKKN